MRLSRPLVMGIVVGVVVYQAAQAGCRLIAERDEGARVMREAQHRINNRTDPNFVEMQILADVLSAQLGDGRCIQLTPVPSKTGEIGLDGIPHGLYQEDFVPCAITIEGLHMEGQSSESAPALGHDLRVPIYWLN